MNWKDLVKSVAPTIGTALGGPLAGAATKFIADKLLGDSHASEETVEATILGASSEQLIKLKELDSQFKTQMKQLDIDVFKLEVQDKESARNRQIQLHDSTPNFLGLLIIILYGLSSYIIFQKSNLTEPQMLVLNNLTNMTMLVLTYYFGSSRGSRIKDLTNFKAGK